MKRKIQSLMRLTKLIQWRFIRNIDFVIPKIFNNVLEHQKFLFVVLPKVILDLKQASSAKIVILRHFKTQGRVFSNNHINDATWAKYLDLQLLSHLNLEDKIHIQGGWNVMTWRKWKKDKSRGKTLLGDSQINPYSFGD